MEQLLTERSLRQLIESRPYYQKSYVPSNDETHWYDRNQMRQFQALMPVANDHSNLNQHDVTHTFASTATNVSIKTFECCFKTSFLRIISFPHRKPTLELQSMN